MVNDIIINKYISLTIYHLIISSHQIFVFQGAPSIQFSQRPEETRLKKIIMKIIVDG